MERWTTVAPSAALAHVVEFFFLTEPSPTGVFEVIPDGKLDVAFVASPERPRFEVYGPATVRGPMPLEPSVAYAGFRLRPGYGATLLQDDAWRYTDQTLEHSALGVTRAEQMLVLTEPKQLEECLGPIARAVAGRASPKAALAGAAARQLCASEGALRIGDLAAGFGVNQRTLERVFKSEVGLTPKTFARIQRLSGIAERLRRGHARWAQLAAELGYADQPHLVREVVRMTGYTPSAFAERVREMPLGWV